MAEKQKRTLTTNPIQDFFSQIRIPFLGDNLMRKYENEKSPLRAELFSIQQLEQYAISLASTHTVSTGPAPEQLLRRLDENAEILLEVRNLLVESSQQNSPVAPAGEWLLDNYYIIEEQIQTGKKHFPKAYSETLPRLTRGPLTGLPRVYHIALEIIAHSDGRVDPDNLFAFVNAYQKVSDLNLGELWAIPIMLRLALIENMRRLAGSLARDRITKNLADYWADRMTQVAEKDPKSLIVITADMARSDPPMTSSFVAELTRRLLGKGPALALPLTWIDQRLSESGLTTTALVHQENQKQAADQVSMSNSIGSLRFINNTDWREFVERTSHVERILSLDPNGIYSQMDFHTRDKYRHIVEQIAKQSKKSETEIARIALQQAYDKQSQPDANAGNTHVGYYLLGKGVEKTKTLAGIRQTKLERITHQICQAPFFLYAGSIILITLALTGLLVLHSYNDQLPVGWLIVTGIISLIATSQLATAVVNWISTIMIPPDFMPRMDFSDGIPATARTLVAVPTLFNSVEEFEDLLETMEVRYLANKQDNLYFALLTDFKDAPQEVMAQDATLLEHARKRIHELNRKYKSEDSIFYLFHRPRKWNAVEKVWMGYERKRGKLTELNAVLEGGSKDAFLLIAGNLDALHDVKYVITLDSDTQLPRETAWKIIGSIAHPLNQPIYDETKRRVRHGYGILQPRLGTNLPFGPSSWYARIFGNEPGIDPYTRSVSDVYQDVLKEGSFIGKGIYEVGAFEKALNGRFPENRVLSHDLLEGCHARSGLISDVQLYEEYPSSYLADVKRRHRWIRGDWQIGKWIFPRVPGPGNRSQKNPISALSRWKIFDNLRRSLVPVALFSMLLFGWLVSGTPWFWTFTAIGIIIPPSLLAFSWGLLKKPADIAWHVHLLNLVDNLVNHLVQHVWTVISLPYEAYVNADAILRTHWRMFISRRNLLQWDPSHLVVIRKNLADHYRTMWIAPAISLLLMITIPWVTWPGFIIASPILILWFLSPAMAWWISIPQERQKANLSTQQHTYLRNLARKTWAYFENFINEQDNWLPPDNYQEVPEPRIAHRTSPTNIGVSLLSNLAAHDFGYINSEALLMRSHETFTTLRSLERYRGHFYNWYDTQTLMPLYPRYVSTVDSGNLAACLLILKEGFLSLYHHPVINTRLHAGLEDTIRVWLEKTKGHTAVKELLAEISSALAEKSSSLYYLRQVFENILNKSQDIADQLYTTEESENSWWANAVIRHCKAIIKELDDIFPWLANLQKDIYDEWFSESDKNHTLNEIIGVYPQVRSSLKTMKPSAAETDDNEWISDMIISIDRSEAIVKDRLSLIDQLVKQCLEYSDYEYDFLYDSAQHYFTIGYNVEEHRRDTGFYDLLGSEARLAVYVAIAQGKVPQESWFALGRQVTNSGTDPVLISWSGSMFEYLMPLMITPSYEASLLDQTYKGAVQRQIDYGRRRGLPWGISESCFNMVHANMDYQYRAFGVPGLGLKRGLSEDYVVAPYASVMATMVTPEEAYQNLRQLASDGYEGRWGFYEAIDFTPSRLQRGQSSAIIRAFMTHHQGMGFLSLAYALLDQPMQKRFQAELQFQTSLLLLQEKIPAISTFYTPAFDVGTLQTEQVNTEVRIINTPHTPVPEVQLLSNGRYHVMVSNSGGGYSRWNDLSITRWREDGTRDHWGNFCFIRDLETNLFWSTAFHPTAKAADHYEVIFSQGRAEIKRRDQNLDAHTEIVVSPEDDVEMRRLHLTNRSRKQRQIEITSYAEVVLNAGIAEMLHPSFSNLFVQTEIIQDRHGILCTRRPRAPEEQPPWMFHLMKVHGTEVTDVSYETSRDEFIGRGYDISEPQSLMRDGRLSGSEGSVLDPVVAIRYVITLRSYETATIDMVYGIGSTRDNCQGLIDKYQDKHMIDRAFELAWTHSNVLLRQINVSASDSMLYSKLAGSIIYTNASFRAEPATIIKNQRGQSGLWGHSISGDWPIVLVQIEDGSKIELIEKLVQAHTFWRLKGLIADLVIWNEDHGGYRQVLHNQILSLIAPANAIEEQDKPGGIFVRTAEQLSNEDRILFQTLARIIISDKLGTLEGQINRRKRLKPVIPLFTPQRSYPVITRPVALPSNLIFDNGLGGYSPDGREYVIKTIPEKFTPAPWSNVIANENFGTVISESGQSYTWFQNAHELRLTPWHNDPVTDVGGEHFYIRDEESGRFWSPTPLPARGKTPYITRHGFGYSVFEHVEDGIRSELWVYVDIEKPVKYSVLKLRNESGRVRQLSATGYVEWVLGDLRHKTLMHIITEPDLNSNAILARNSYTTEFGHLVSFFDVNDPNRTITTDREEFIGRNGSFKKPDALLRSKLSGKTGAALDPCAVIQSMVNLEDGEEAEIVFRLGTGMHMNDLTYLIRQGRGKTAAREVLERVIGFWEKSLSVIKIESPDSALDLLTNGWLNYQTLSCRMWARSGYYQSGGAFGFRDQLQDVLSLLHNEPAIARHQIILCASRQFVQGDVQHWWHPPVGRGVRTRCSDDYLWLPYVTSRYVIVTGDTSILDEKIQYLESRELGRDEHSYYDLPIRSDQTGTLYEHCVRAIENGLQFGKHGLPLIGSGDWNDGMDRVGTEGKGESVWLAWFLMDTISRFVEIASLCNDIRLVERCNALMITLKTNIEKHAWDGAWYRRAYFDDGTPLGSEINDECKIDSIAQSWSIISGAGQPGRSAQGLAEAEQRLVRPHEKIIQLFDPPFDKSALNPGYIKGYVPGVRENGGQYTHAAIWMIMAFAIKRDKTKIWQLLQMINPVNHSRTAEDIAIYKAEPYVIAADVYAVEQHAGRGGWTWYTGSAGWMYQLVIDYVFGLRRMASTLQFMPCLPLEWEKAKIRYRYKASVYHILFIQHFSDHESMHIKLDGVPESGDTIALQDDGREHHIEISLSSVK